MTQFFPFSPQADGAPGADSGWEQHHDGAGWVKMDFFEDQVPNSSSFGPKILALGSQGCPNPPPPHFWVDFLRLPHPNSLF